MKTRVILLILTFICSTAFSENLTKEQILNDADARIEKYRTSAVTLKILNPDGAPLPPGTTVHIKQTNHQFLFGSNIFNLDNSPTDQQKSAYKQQFAEIFNFATLPFYWWSYVPTPGKNNDDRTNHILAFCASNNITPKGHPLAWNFRDPRWLSNDPTDAMNAQMARITRCVEKFTPNLNIWDVVNEATHYDRKETKQRSPILTKAITEMGVPNYLKTAFKTARKANPDATLLINDYNTDQAYANNIISKLIDEAGTPLYDIIGIQSHMHSGTWSPEKTWQVCERFAKFNKPLHFTELTITSGPKTKTSWQTTVQGEANQAKQVIQFYRILFSHPAVEAITWWDFSDQNAWQKAPAGLIRKDMTPKPAYTELKKLIKNTWSTDTKLKTDKDSKVTFKAYHGTYRIKLESQTKQQSAKLNVDKNTLTLITVKLKKSN